MSNPIAKEQEKIDDYLITTCIVLLGGFTIILSLNKTPSPQSSIFSVISILSFILTLAFSFWHKYRKAVRKALFEEKQTKLLDEFTEDMKALLETVGKFAELEGKNYALSHPNELREDKDFFEKMKKEIPTMPGRDRIVHALVENIGNKIQIASKEAFDGQLKEKGALPKYIFEYVATKFRYYIFSIGLISFFISLVLNLAIPRI